MKPRNTFLIFSLSLLAVGLCGYSIPSNAGVGEDDRGGVEEGPDVSTDPYGQGDSPNYGQTDRGVEGEGSANQGGNYSVADEGFPERKEIPEIKVTLGDEKKKDEPPALPKKDSPYGNGGYAPYLGGYDRYDRDKNKNEAKCDETRGVALPTNFVKDVAVITEVLKDARVGFPNVRNGCFSNSVITALRAIDGIAVAADHSATFAWPATPMGRAQRNLAIAFNNAIQTNSTDQAILTNIVNQLRISYVAALQTKLNEERLEVARLPLGVDRSNREAALDARQAEINGFAAGQQQDSREFMRKLFQFTGIDAPIAFSFAENQYKEPTDRVPTRLGRVDRDNVVNLGITEVDTMQAAFEKEFGMNQRTITVKDAAGKDVAQQVYMKKVIGNVGTVGAAPGAPMGDPPGQFVVELGRDHYNPKTGRVEYNAKSVELTDIQVGNRTYEPTVAICRTSDGSGDSGHYVTLEYHRKPGAAEGHWVMFNDDKERQVLDNTTALRWMEKSAVSVGYKLADPAAPKRVMPPRLKTN